MHIRGVYKKYTRVGDFDMPTHQPTSIHVYTNKQEGANATCAFYRKFYSGDTQCAFAHPVKDMPPRNFTLMLITVNYSINLQEIGQGN